MSTIPADYEYCAEGIRISALMGTAPKLSKRQPYYSAYDFHTHFWHELFYAKHSELILHTKDEELVIPQGKILLVHPHTLHYVTNDSRNPVFSFSVTASAAKPTAYAALPALTNGTVQVFEGNPICDMLITVLEDAFHHHHAIAAGNHLFGLLLQLKKTQSAPLSPVPSDSDMARLYKIDYLLTKYATGGITLTEVAKELSLSTRQLSRIIQTQYGCSFSEKITQLRMREAEHLLRNGMTAAEAAAETGYASLRGFYSAFTGIYGVTPGEYRKQQQK